MTDDLKELEQFATDKAVEGINSQLPQDRAEFEEDGNQATAQTWSRNPQTLEELLEHCKVDMSIWQVERFVCNKWDQGAKLPDGSVVVTPLFQIKAWLIRKVAVVTEFPPVQPIQINVKLGAWPKLPKRGGVKKAIVLPDMQVGFRRDLITGELDPFHDRRAMDVALQITRYVNPDRIVLLGDNMDLPDWSDKFIRSPEFQLCTQPAAVELAWYYTRLRALGRHIHIDAIEGNHDFRMAKAVMANMAQSYGLKPVDDLNGPPLISMERLLGLADRDITYHGPYPHGSVWLNDNLMLHHGEVARSKSGATVRTVAEDLRHSEGQGHIHRAEMASKTAWSREGPKVYTAFSPGTLARIDPGVVPAHKHRQNWQQALAEVEYEEGNGFLNVKLIMIYDGVALYEGRRWVARPEHAIVDQLETETMYDFHRRRAA